jgi:two-component system, chemotaxis family, CheB/CheR fusion protein
LVFRLLKNSEEGEVTPNKKPGEKKVKPEALLRPPTKEKKPPAEKGPSGNPLYIVGMGGSAGGLEAFEQFFQHLPADTGLAFVIVTHLDPTQKGIMPELLQRFTPLKVFQARDGMAVKADTVYVIPPNKDMGILNGALQLLEPSAPRGLRLPIDFFFRHLADDQKERAVGIILSGMGTDGTLGLRAIKEQMGLAMVQDPQSAKFDGMPRSARETGLADFIAPVEELPEKLISFTKHFLKIRTTPVALEKKILSAFQKILLLLRAKTGNDFSLYKKNTILRRIDRRMSVHQITNVPHYVTYLQHNPQEIDLLFKEMLIGVTNFFRDPEAFATLKEKVVERLLAGKGGHGILRIWVPGCSTGEEAYSLAILLRECLDQKPHLDLRTQIYATDIDPQAIQFARQGLYPNHIAADVPADRLQRYFHQEDAHYRIRKEIRNLVVFAPQNLVSDPPFTRLDLLCCRNLLIYFNPEVQKKILPLFYYALIPGGFLFLGPSETIGGYHDLFAPVDSKWKIYSRRESLSATIVLPEFPVPFTGRARTEERHPEPLLPKTGSLPDLVQQFIVSHVSPPAVLINPKGDLLYSTQRTGRYLEPPIGRASLNVFEMAREGLKLELAAAVRKAFSQEREVKIKGVPVKSNGDRLKVNVTVKPFPVPENSSGLLLILFEEVPLASPPSRAKPQSEKDLVRAHRLAELEKDLQYTKENLQTTIEEMETSQEELKSANEELQSTNEELQSTNEELTTSKEELQSLNEELMTLNAELQVKNDELSLANNDLRNLLNSTQIPTLFLDNDLKVKRFTNQAGTIFSLIAGDVGRPITDIVSSLQYGTLLPDVRAVLDTLMLQEKQLQTNDGRWFTMRIMPYRTLENRIEGVVITFQDITGLKQLEQLLKEKEQLRLLAMVVRESGDAYVIQDLDGKILAWNRGAERLYGWTEKEALGQNIRLIIPESNRGEYEHQLKNILEGEKVEAFEAPRLTQEGRYLEVWVLPTRLTDEEGRIIAVAAHERELGPTEKPETDLSKQGSPGGEELKAIANGPPAASPRNPQQAGGVRK